MNDVKLARDPLKLYITYRMLREGKCMLFMPRGCTLMTFLRGRVSHQRGGSRSR